MKIELDVTRINVLTGQGADIVMLTTTLPIATWPYTETGLSLKFEAAAGTGKDYAFAHFPGAQIDVVYIGGNRPKFNKDNE